MLFSFQKSPFVLGFAFLALFVTMDIPTVFMVDGIGLPSHTAQVEDQPASFMMGNLACSAGANQITGQVFEDFDYDGLYDSSDRLGIKGLPVTATDALGNSFNAVTDASGAYSLTGLTVGRTYKVAFTFPDSLTWASVTRKGADNGTATQFVQPGSCANLGVASPSDYCQSNPDVVVPCYIIGANDGPDSTGDAIVILPYLSEGHDFVGATPTGAYVGAKPLEWKEIGAVYGEAWQASHQKLYLSAFHKRLSGFGPYGPDAIYQLDKAGAITGVIELDTVLMGADLAGPEMHDFTIDVNGNMFDSIAFSMVGKTSFGDLEISADGNSLFVVNLYDSTIYNLDISSGITADVTLANSWATPTPCAGSSRPFGLSFHRGELWVGIVCENADTAYVYSLNTSTGIYTKEVTVPLDYDREYVFVDGAPQTDGNWNPWENDLPTVTYSEGPGSPKEIIHPQAILSDIEFDHQTGDMILGFRDRWGDQMGQNLPVQPGTTSPMTFADAGGDVLKVCNTTIGWSLEGTTACPTLGNNLNSGPGGSTYAEFYNWDFFSDLDPLTPEEQTSAVYHRETFMGGLLQLAQEDYVMTTIMDPYNDYSAGITRNNNSTGRREGIPASDTIFKASLIGGYTIYDSGDFAGGPPSNITFAKGNGLGDIEALCHPAPIEIGNYVWRDTDGDGTQDGGEDGITNIRVELYDDLGTLLAFDTTDAKGQYYFAGNNIDAATWQTANDTLNPNTDYYLVIGNGQFASSLLTVNGKSYTVSPDSTDTGANRYDEDSDGRIFLSSPANAFDNLPGVLLTTGNVGETDHSLDFGFIAIPFDYGDLPDMANGTTGNRDYETYDSTGGPSHQIIAGLMLGDTIDMEFDGQPDTLAVGDDNNDQDDDDGLTIIPTLNIVPGSTIRLPLSVTNTTGDTAYIEAWVDWNADGDFEDPNEQLASLQDNEDGVFPVHLTISVPNNATTGSLVGLRIRLSNSPHLTPYGPTDSGEVEDYLLGVNCNNSNCLPIGASLIRQ